MRRFVLLFVALVLSVPLTGCGGDEAPSTPKVALPPDIRDPTVHGEAKKAQEEQAREIAEKVAKATKASEPKSKAP